MAKILVSVTFSRNRLSQISKRFISKMKNSTKTKLFPVTSATDVKNLLKEQPDGSIDLFSLVCKLPI